MGGTLDIAIKKNPKSEWSEGDGDHHTDLAIEPLEWEKLFFDTLSAPKWETYLEGEDIVEYYER